MKKLIILVLVLSFLTSKSQQQQFTIHNISLPNEIASPDNQFSGLYVYEGRLFLMSESRLEEGAEGKLYSINLADLDRKVKDTAYILPYRKYHLYNLESIRDSIEDRGQSFEGLEALIIDSNTVYLSVETTTPSRYCFLLKGMLNDTAVVMDNHYIAPLAKPVSWNGIHIYNAGFEAIEKRKDSIFNFFEYNFFRGFNYVYALNSQLFSKDVYAHPVPVDQLPFRITDITKSGNHFTAINYFFKGGDGDTIYRTPSSEIINNKLIKIKGDYKDYCRLINVTYSDNHFEWKPFWEFPEQYSSYNWEGIAAYKGGYFIINDKYTPTRPYQTVLLYLKKK